MRCLLFVLVLGKIMMHDAIMIKVGILHLVIISY